MLQGYRLVLGRSCLRYATAALILTAVPSSVFAQWLNYPTAGVPKTADGKPNLSAPAPKTADGKPDLSGMGDNYTPRRPAAGPNFNTFASNDDFLKIVKSSPFWDIGSSFKDGLPFQPWAAELHRQ